MNQETAEKPRNVMIVITKATAGGAQRYVRDIVTHLSRQYRTILVYGQAGRLSEELDAYGVQSLRIPQLVRDLSIVADVQSFFALRAAIRETVPDVLHLNSSKAAALGALAGRTSGVGRIVYTVHGWPFKEDRGAISRFFIYMISWLSALLSHAVIVVSKRDETIAKRMWWVRKKAYLIPLAREPISFLTPNEAYAKMFGALTPPPLGADTVRLVTIAELTRNKGIRYALEAVRNLVARGVDCIYVVVGAGEELGMLRTHAQTLGIADRVFFPGYIEDAAAYLKGFDVFVLPSVKEGTPYVILEAGAAGLPVVATEAIDSQLADEIPHIKRVPIKNALAIADAIQESAHTLQIETAPQSRSLETMVGETAALYRA